MRDIKILVQDEIYWESQRRYLINKLHKLGLTGKDYLYTHNEVIIPLLNLRISKAYANIKYFRGTHSLVVLQQPYIKNMPLRLTEDIYFRCNRLAIIRDKSDLYEEVVKYVKNNKEEITKARKSNCKRFKR